MGPCSSISMMTPPNLLPLPWPSSMDYCVNHRDGIASSSRIIRYLSIPISSYLRFSSSYKFRVSLSPTYVPDSDKPTTPTSNHCFEVMPPLTHAVNKENPFSCWKRGSETEMINKIIAHMAADDRASPLGVGSMPNSLIPWETTCVATQRS